VWRDHFGHANALSLAGPRAVVDEATATGAFARAGKRFGSDLIRTEALDFCSDAFPSREPASTSLENAMVKTGSDGGALTAPGATVGVKRRDVRPPSDSKIQMKKPAAGFPARAQFLR
jgi:hypothetical protein